MTNAKKLLAAILTVIMVASLMTCFTFAATPVFANDYVSYPSSDKIPEIKNTACIVSVKARNRAVGTKINIDWDGQTWEFTVGVNAFATFDEACKAADLAARGATPQVILSAGTYPELRIKSSVEVFGANWNDNPNVVNTEDPTKQWELNSKWTVNPTVCNDIVIDGAAAGEITIVGMEIAHRFYDSFRPQSSTKTVLKLINTYLNQTDTSTALLTLPTPRSTNMRHFAMSFWNLNSHNTGASAANNTDETHIINFRIGKLDMAKDDNRLFDEKISPTFVIDGFCADYKNVSLLQFSWFKWAPYKNAKIVLKNSYITPFQGKGRNGRYDFCGFYTDKTPDTSIGESGEVEITNNIFYDSYESNGKAEVRVFGVEYSKITYEDNLVINTGEAKSEFISTYNLPIGDLSEVVYLKNNTFLGYNINIDWGNADTKIDMTGSYIAPTWSADYKTKQENVLPAGNVRYDYCYIDGAKTIKTDEVQEFNIAGMTIDHDAATIEESVRSGVFYKDIVIEGQAVCDIYASDKDYSNIDSYELGTPLGNNLSLTGVDNYYIFVAFSPDRANRKVYTMKISRPSQPDIELVSLSDKATAIDALSYNVTLEPDEDSFTFAPVAQDSAEITVTLGDAVINPSGNSYTLTGVEKGKEYICYIDLVQGSRKERFTLFISRALSAECELLSVDSKLTPVDGGYKASVVNGQTTLEIAAEISDGASAFITLGTAVYPYANGKFVIDNPKADNYKIIVVAENGTTKNAALTISAQKNNEAKVISIENATAVSGGFEASAVTSFKVLPTVSQGAGYKVFSDAACTTLLANNTVTVSDAPVTVYIVVTAEDGTVAQPVALTVKKTADELPPEQPEKPEIKDTSKIYTDIKATGWYKKYVDYAVTYGIFSGTSATKFSPDDKITRAQFVQVLANLSGVDTTNRNVTTSFTDVPAKKWYTPAVKWASENGIVNGVGNGKFDPEAYVTREQMCVMLVNYAKFKNITLKTVEAKSNFADNSKISSWAVDEVYACQQADIVNGKGAGIFDPQGTGTRAEACAMFTKFHQDYLAK